MKRALLLALFETTTSLKFSSSVSATNSLDDGCGVLASFPHAKPANHEDARRTRYDQDIKKTVKNTFATGSVIKFHCEPGFTSDGSREGAVGFDVECEESGVFKQHGVCSKVSKCGKMPMIDHAAPTGKVHKAKVEYACLKGYSLDGEKVVVGGFGKNSHFEVECVDFKGKYEEFTGKCQPFAFVPATETIRLYNEVFKALFVVSCKGTLTKNFGKCGKDGKCEPPTGLDTACSKISQDADGFKQGKCDELVSKVKEDFEKKKSARKDFYEGQKEADWTEKDQHKNRPHLNDEAENFCSDLFGVLSVPAKK